MAQKPKLAIYWAASCGGCEIAVVNLHERILDVDAAFDLFFCPCLLDTKVKDVEALTDRGIAITLFNGAIRNSENEEMARLMRRKSEVLVAFGSCAAEGGIPGLANLSSADDLLREVYVESPSTFNPKRTLPRAVTEAPEGTLRIPTLTPQVKVLADVVDVDYYVPGCPPEPHRIWEVVDAIIKGVALPPKGSVIGAGKSTVCYECARSKEDKTIEGFQRTYEASPDSERCLLEQGVICMGIATRDGCGALCPKVNMPCTGCYGPPEGVRDQGAKMVAALGSILDVGGLKGLTEEEIAAKVESVTGGIPDPAGTFYKFSLPNSILKGKVR